MEVKTNAPSTHGLGVIAEPGLSLVLCAALEMAGREVVTGPPAEVWQALAEGRVDRVLRLGATAERDPTWVAAGSPHRAAVTWIDSPTEHKGLEDILARVGVREPPSPHTRWDSGPLAVSSASLLGAILQLRPSLKLVVERGGATLALCVADGRVLAVGIEGQRFFHDLAIVADPGLRLPLQIWAAPAAALDARQALHADLGFLCEYDALFTRSPAYQRHVARVIADLLSGGCDSLHIEGHAASPHGVPLASALFEAAPLIAPELRRRLIGDMPLRGSGSIPELLRPALPPSRFGRLYFALEDGAVLDALPAGRLSPVEVEGALLVGLLAGVLRRLPPPRAAGAPSTQGPFVRPRGLRAPEGAGEAEGQQVTTPTGVPGRVRTGTMPLGTPFETPAVSLADPRCGTPRRFLDLLRTIADEGERRHKRARIPGTRFAPTGLVAGDLLLFFTIGAGGHGSVLVATTEVGPLAGRVFAVKRLGAQHIDNPEVRAGFVREARLMQSLAHPHIVVGHGGLDSDLGPLFAMELVHGVSLAELVQAAARAERSIPDAVTRAIGLALASALDYVHHLEAPDGGPLALVHRDVAPANVLLGFDGRVKLTDFSVAQASRPDLAPAARTARSGRLGYMAPESLLAPPGPQADVFGLACCLYELATLTPALERLDPSASLEALVQATHVPVLARAPHLDPRLAYAIERGLAPRPSERFASAAALGNAIAPRGGEDDAAAGNELLVKMLDELFGDLRARELEALGRMLPSADAPA